MRFGPAESARPATNAWIADPDRSNPTRPRLERPLDTIRSFEAAVDGSYSRRASYKAGTNDICHIATILVADSNVIADSGNPTFPQNNRRSGYFPGENLSL